MNFCHSVLEVLKINEDWYLCAVYQKQKSYSSGPIRQEYVVMDLKLDELTLKEGRFTRFNCFLQQYHDVALKRAVHETKILGTLVSWINENTEGQWGVHIMGELGDSGWVEWVTYSLSFEHDFDAVHFMLRWT